MSEIKINLNDNIIPMYIPILGDMLLHKHTHYVFAGGRGSTKSSFAAMAIPIIMTQYPNVHAIVFRKIGNTIQKSTRSNIEWAIRQLGLENMYNIPKSYSNPIVNKYTGQQIIFMGLDDPAKVKSIKLPFGYLGISWFEELDQYAGENELRNVLQSTMRGGQLFWDIRTFNPPISKNNWANEYADIAETRPNTKVVRNTYLDVSRDWLGEQFIEEAEELKELNENAYKHEYLGIPVGTGGDVFANVEDLDMNQLIEVDTWEGKKKVPMWTTFDHIYNGIDWGFAKDPFQYVRCHFDAKHLDLYIFNEFRTTKTRNEQVFDILYNDRKYLTTDELVTADSAEPKSIADFRAYGAFIRGADKGADSVRYGIKWLQSLRHIYIDKRRCPDTYREFIEYEYEQDRDGSFISAYPDSNNHCVTGDTLVKTVDGEKSIKELVNTCGTLYSYDYKGNIVEKKYTDCRKTREGAEIYELELANGYKLKATSDHLILTVNGWKMLKDLTESDEIIVD